MMCCVFRLFLGRYSNLHILTPRLRQWGQLKRQLTRHPWRKMWPVSLAGLGVGKVGKVETMLDGFFYDTCGDNLHDTYI